MGSVIAWNFTQRIAGILMIPTGLVLTIIAYVKVGEFPGYDMMTMAMEAFDVIKTQVICAFVIYVFIFLLTAVLFNRKGDCRFGQKVHDLICKLVPKKVLAQVYVQEFVPYASEEEDYEEDPEEEYEEQDSGVITADDIVIENL